MLVKNALLIGAFTIFLLFIAGTLLQNGEKIKKELQLVEREFSLEQNCMRRNIAEKAGGVAGYENTTELCTYGPGFG